MNSPVHFAYDELPIVTNILRKAYPDQSAEHIRDRANYVVSQRWGLGEHTLANYERRSRSQPQRIGGQRRKKESRPG